MPAHASPLTFIDLGVPERLVRRLARDGITTPFPVQAATLPDALAGRDVLGRGRTGSGKTLAFALPLLARLADGHRARARRPRGLVLVPTRELATQVEDVLAGLAGPLGLSTMTVFGGVPAGRQTEKLKAGVDVVVACPGRLEDLLRCGHVDLSAVRVTVLDEADHMADLGFLPAVRRLLDATPRDGQRLLFSATLDRDVDVLVRRYLREPARHHVDPAGVSVTTSATHHVLHVGREHRVAVLADLAAAPGRTVVFTRTKRAAKTLTRQLKGHGVPAVELHGDLAQGARTRNLDSFSSGRVETLVATDIAARGIHVDDVTLVVHADPPAEHKAYLHRSGRTARAGDTGTVVTMTADDQAAAVRDLMRRAGIEATTSRVGRQDPILQVIAPGARTFVRAADHDPQARLAIEPRRPRRQRRPSREARPGTHGSTSRPHSAAGFSAGARGR
jgi:superfamily II DNA/RNA helicase